MDGINVNPSNPLPPLHGDSPDGTPADAAPAAGAGPAQAGHGALQNRTVAIGSGEDTRTAHAACAAIKTLLGGLSNMLMAVMLSPAALLKGIHSYVIKPCIDEFQSMWEDANRTGPQRPAWQPPPHLSSLDRTSQSFNGWINRKLGLDNDR